MRQNGLRAKQGPVDQRENRWSSTVLEKSPTPAVHRPQRSAAKVWPSTGNPKRSCPRAVSLFNSTRGANSTPLPVVTWTRSAASAGSHPIATSIATLTNVLVAPVSRAKRRMALPLGPLSSAPMTMRPRAGVNEKLTTQSQYPEASCPCRQSQTAWGGSRQPGGRPPRDPCHARAPFRSEPPGPHPSMGPRSVSTRSRILPRSRRSSGLRPSVALPRRIIERGPFGAGTSIVTGIDGQTHFSGTGVFQPSETARSSELPVSSNATYRERHALAGSIKVCSLFASGWLITFGTTADPRNNLVVPLHARLCGCLSHGACDTCRPPPHQKRVCIGPEHPPATG